MSTSVALTIPSRPVYCIQDSLSLGGTLGRKCYRR